MSLRVIFFIDGENITYRYQAMVKDGYRPFSDVVHELDTFVWAPKVTSVSGWLILRISYYTSIVGDDVRLQKISERIADIRYHYDYGFGFLNPHIFKKQNRTQKTKSVDINLVTDLLRHTYNKSVDEVFILSGDGDYIPTIQEVMRQGIRVSVGAFSSGLDPRLRIIADEFVNLDNLFFEKGEKN
jgi:uncharacterized LabA/DUF88 family protein